jgi:hypothetical protein
MTELVIVSKPRGRVVRWIGGGVYRDYLSPISATFSTLTPLNITASNPGNQQIYYLGPGAIAQSFKTPNISPLYFYRVEVYLRKSGSPTGTANIRLTQGSTVLAQWTLDVSTISTSYAYYDFTASPLISLSPNTTYWIVVEYTGGNVNNNIWWQFENATDVYPDGVRKYRTGGDAGDPSTWDNASGYDAVMRVYYATEATLSFDFIYNGGYSFQKRLVETRSLTNCAVQKIYVNGVDKGSAALTQTTDIPQADNYTLKWIIYPTTTAAGSLSVSIQRQIYYYGTTLSINDLQATEAYVQQIKFGSSGGLIRFDKDPYCELPGSANEVITFSGDVYVPFRYLELVIGTAEILLIAVE